MSVRCVNRLLSADMFVKSWCVGAAFNQATSPKRLFSLVLSLCSDEEINSERFTSCTKCCSYFALFSLAL